MARWQFAFVVVWHFLFPAFTRGLASFLATLEALWLWTKRSVYLDVFHYWLRIFAIAFAMGVVSGIVMSYQFGTNWSAFSDKVGPVIGPLLGYEVLTAFFLDAGFLGVMLFGLKRVGPKLHFAATLLVAGGTLISTFWIISAKSWMQTPAGFTLLTDGRVEPADWLQVIFNPSFPFRYLHVVAAAYLTHRLDGEVRGLTAWPRADWPTNVALVFFAFRIMVGLGVLIVALGAASLLMRRRQQLFDARWLHRWAVAMGPAGFAAVTAGWITTEAGRQPYTVYGLLRTADSVGPVAAPAVATSLLGFVVVYTAVFGAGILFLLHLVRQAPAAHDPGPPPDMPARSPQRQPSRSIMFPRADTVAFRTR